MTLKERNCLVLHSFFFTSFFIRYFCFIGDLPSRSFPFPFFLFRLNDAEKLYQLHRFSFVILSFFFLFLICIIIFFIYQRCVSRVNIFFSFSSPFIFFLLFFLLSLCGFNDDARLLKASYALLVFFFLCMMYALFSFLFFPTRISFIHFILSSGKSVLRWN